MAGFWGRRSREAEAAAEQLAAADADLSRRARTALVTVDERIRSTDDELAFAAAELGDEATGELRVALSAVREHLTEAFQLHQLNHDEIPDTAEELRTRNARIVQLCDWAEQVLDERTEALRERVERVRRAPEVLQGVRDREAALRARLPEARDTLTRLGARYDAAALARVRMSADDAEQLLDFALQSADLSARRRAAGKNGDANLALETATESVRRAASLLESVDEFEVEALRTQATLADVIDDSRSDLAAARAERRTPAVDAAMAALQSALDDATATRDPFSALTRLSAANAALDAARERAARPVITEAQLQHGVDAADRTIGVASSLITGHRGWIGADARTRLAEAERLRSEVAGLGSAEESREEALRRAHRASALAEEAKRLAQRDIDSARPQQGGWDDAGGWGGGNPRGGHPGGRGGQGSSGLLGPILGGVILGGLLDDIFD